MNAITEKSSNHFREWIIIGLVIAVVTTGYFVFTPGVAEELQPVAESDSTAAHGTPGGSMEALNNLPTDYAGLVGLGNQQMDAGNLLVAAEIYRRALELDGSSPDVRSDYGACLHGAGLSDRALQVFHQVMSTNPEHAVVHFNAGIVHAAMGKVDSARVHFETYLEMDPNGRAAAGARQNLKNLGI